MSDNVAAQAFFEEGRRLLGAGDIDAGACKISEAIHAAPDFVPGYLTLARLALEAGEPAVCMATLEKGLERAGEHPDLRLRLALVHQRRGDTRMALDNYARVVAVAPDHAGAWLKLGVCHGELGDPEAAAVAIQRAMLLKPELREAAKDQSLPEVMRAELVTATRLLRARYSAMVQTSLDAARAAYPGVDLHRLEEAFEFLQGRPRRLSHPDQQPGFLLFPDMPARPWYEREEFDWAERVEAATPAILEELATIRDQGEGFAPYLHGVSQTGNTTTYTGEDFSVLADSMEWNAYHLMKAGEIETNTARCPRTMELMQSLPLAEARAYMPEIFFSILRPGAHIVPHFGQMNIRLTVHLGLDIPERCGLRVHEESREWQAGKLLVFDDSFRHEAWNHSDQERVVLIFEVWNPDLSAAEIFGIQAFLEARAEWMSQFPDSGDQATQAVS